MNIFFAEKFSLGEELDSPLFYIVPVIECSDCEMPTLYNIAVPNKESKRYSCLCFCLAIDYYYYYYLALHYIQ